MTTITIPEGHEFGLQTLPYGIFSVDGDQPRVGVRVADQVLDLSALPMGEGDEVFARPTLNDFMAQGYERWVAVRERIRAAVQGELPDSAVHSVDSVTLHLPVAFADYVDFYASEHHASNLGRLFRPDNPNPLMPNWKHLPVGYHGRAGTIICSGTDVVRPCGQSKAPDAVEPTFGPSKRLDIEAEMAFIVGSGSQLGDSVAASDFDQHIFGAVIFNDWSARDIQAWEYVPLGPNLGKSFASSISPWVVPMLALQEAKVPAPHQEPTPLPYLHMDQPWGLDIDLEVVWNGEVVTRPPFKEMYWSPAQMLAHMTVNGASTATGDIFASGTISGPDKEQRGAFIELTWGGAEPVSVGGQQRTFVEDGDTITIRASAVGPDGTRVGFGEVSTTILPARIG